MLTWLAPRTPACWHGFEVTQRTDGARNEEHEPDARIVWQAGGSAAGGEAPARDPAGRERR